MHKFNRNFITEWRKLKLPFEDETFIIAVSGGVDSVSLLLVLHELRTAKKLNLNLVVAHFNHDLRGAESENDAKFVRDLAKKLDVECVSEIQNPKSKIRNQNDNLEQAARRARYEFLFKVARVYNAFGVLTAHTINDQAETFLLNLIRGSGAAGLGAMKAIRKFDENSEILLIRPLLNWAKREATVDFVREKRIEFRTDSMNEDEKFSRVRVRKKIIPLLAEFNPKIVETLAKTAGLLQEDASERAAVGNQSSVNPAVKDLKPLSKSTVYNILREWLRERRGDLRGLELKHVEAVESLIFSRKSGRKVELPGGESVVKKAGKLYFEKAKVEKSGFGI